MPAISFYAMVNVDHKNQCRNSEVQLRKRRKGKRKQQSPRLSICFISPSLPIHTRFKALESIRIMPFPPMIRKYSFSGQETEFELQMWRSSKLGRMHCCLSVSHSFILPLSKQKDDFKILGIHTSSPSLRRGHRDSSPCLSLPLHWAKRILSNSCNCFPSRIEHAQLEWRE